jgi:hypothetical protein
MKIKKKNKTSNQTSCIGNLCIYETHRVLIHFQVCSQNCEKRLLASSCQSVCPHGTLQLPLEEFL